MYSSRSHIFGSTFISIDWCSYSNFHVLNNDINQISCILDCNVWNKTKEIVINSTKEMLGVEPKKKKENRFSSNCKNLKIEKS